MSKVVWWFYTGITKVRAPLYTKIAFFFKLRFFESVMSVLEGAPAQVTVQWQARPPTPLPIGPQTLLKLLLPLANLLLVPPPQAAHEADEASLLGKKTRIE